MNEKKEMQVNNAQTHNRPALEALAKAMQVNRANPSAATLMKCRELFTALSPAERKMNYCWVWPTWLSWSSAPGTFEYDARHVAAAKFI